MTVLHGDTLCIFPPQDSKLALERVIYRQTQAFS